MTLIIGIKCKDGAVLASDGAVTGTITQQSKKLSIIKRSAVIGSSGPVGLSQRFAGTLDLYCKNEQYFAKAPFHVMSEIADIMRYHILQEARVADQLKSMLGDVNRMWMASIMIALPLQNGVSLFSFDYTGAPCEATVSLPYVSIGSGTYLAEPFLSFIRPLIWTECPPDLGVGILSAVWSLGHAIKTSPGGVSLPIQVVILRREGGTFEARELTESELDEPRQAIEDIEKRIAKTATEISTHFPIPPAPPDT